MSAKKSIHNITIADGFSQNLIYCVVNNKCNCGHLGTMLTNNKGDMNMYFNSVIL